VSAWDFVADTAMGAIGGKIAGEVVPYVFKNFVPTQVKGAIGEGLTWLDTVASGRGIPKTQVPNGFGDSTFDFQLPSSQLFIESKFGTATINSGAQSEAAAYWGSQGLLEVQKWNYSTISGIVGSSVSSSFAGSDFGASAAGGYLIYPNKPNTNMMQGVYSK
jgi:hypothetical protein